MTHADTSATATRTLTTAQAIIAWLEAQYITIDGEEMRVCGGGFGIFGHGNVTCLGEALYGAQDTLPLYRGQNEQSMGFAAAGYAKQWLRQRFMFCTASAGPGTSNLVTSAALAHANRLPMLMLCGDTYQTRLPDPVLQQLEHYGDPTLGVNDAFRAVSRYWDRITHPAQVIQSLPAALATLLDPADCGPAFIGLPQDVQGWTYDYPEAFFAKRVHRIRRQTPDADELVDAAALLKSAKRPMVIAGGGVQYSRAVADLIAFAETHQIPVVETIAGRANLTADHPLNIGPIGVTGSDSANAIAEQADAILAVGTRLQDFTTGSWTAFDAGAKFVSLNAARHDAAKHLSLPLVGDAKLGLQALGAALGDMRADAAWLAQAQELRTKWDAYVAGNVSFSDNTPNSYAQAIGVVNEMVHRRDRVVAAAGGLPAEVAANWRTLDAGTVDIEFGFSCMGYEISGAWGARIAQMQREPERDTVVFIGDGSYLMMNSDIYSSVLTQKKLIILVLDNGGFAVINKLQNNTGNQSFNNLIADSPTIPAPFAVDFEAHARAMGANAETVTMAELPEAFKRAKASDKTYVICAKVDAYDGWTTQGHTWWEVGTPHTSKHASIRDAHAGQESIRSKQRKGV
jgi:3D-(3,5/4)-trihydroxycyclohexane-1,2-dione acylhydrolase (decyclizing)